MKRCVGVSKLRLMAADSKYCVVCHTELVKPAQRHKCADHEHWTLVVVDSETMPVDRFLGELWEEP